MPEAAEPEVRAQASTWRPRPRVRLWIGVALLGLYVAIALAGPRIAPFDPDDQDLLNILGAPDAEHWLGTDQIGRDQLSRLLVGTRFTLAMTAMAVGLSVLLGATLGLVAGFFGGRIDAAITGLVDLLLTVPNLILAIAIASVIGAGMTGLVIATTSSFVPGIARLIRGRVLEIREEEYVQAAITVGMRDARVILRHVLPNAVTVIVIEASLVAGQAVLVGTALGFLGLGVQPPAPEWGTMLGAGREFLDVAPHLVVLPGIAISLLIFGFNMLGDGLRDALDPHART
jgi:ABC-type dipeptide/oligopeptide/nickel transport system permease subunit